MAVKKATTQPKSQPERIGIPVNKTYKIFINGAFPRSESGRYTELKDARGEFLANVCLSSRKDFRNAGVAARAAQQSWQYRNAYNKSQIVYRIAEMLHQKEGLFVAEMVQMGYTAQQAGKEFNQSVDLLVYFAGWCDKYIQVFSAVNPVASSHFNFSVPEPTGVVAALANNKSALLGMVQAVIPAICGGNTVVALASEAYPLCAVSFAEVLATSDVPAGIINILTGKRAELQSHFASHMDVNALIAWDISTADQVNLVKVAAENVKRTHFYESEKTDETGPEYIMDLQEIKTTWHPIEVISGSSSGY